MGGLGALSKLAKMLRVKGPELSDEARRAKLDETAYEMSIGQRPSAGDQRSLLDFLRNEGASPEWADMHPGAMPHSWKGGDKAIQSYRAPSPEDRLWRGGETSLKLGNPSFFTTDPKGALYYATEGPGASGEGFGALGEYSVRGANPAKLRDMYRALLEDTSLLDSAANHPNGNIWDYLYDPRVRQAMQDRGFNSAVGSDPLGMGDIEAFIALDKSIVQPLRRRIVGFEGNPVGDHFSEITPLGDDYVQFGKTRPWSKKKQGGLV